MSLIINSTEIIFLIVQVLAVLFLAILFLQSGIDKVLFKKEKFEPVLFLTITVVELLSGVLNLLGVIFLLFDGNFTLALWGTILASIALIMLFFGQRMAKDYVGAQSLVSYFILTILTLITFGYTI